MAQDKQTRSVERTLQILNAFSIDRPSLGLVQLSEALNLPKATVLRLSSTLCKHGFLRRDEDSKKYSLGLRLFGLGGIVFSSFSLRHAASPHVRRLRDRLGKMISLAVLDDDDLLYIDKRDAPNHAVRFASTVGTRRPPHFGMLGLVLMAYLSESEVERILQKKPLVAFTRKSIATRHGFREKLRQVREQGFSVDDGMVLEGIGGIAAPVRDFTSNVVAALGAGFMIATVNAKELKKIEKDVVETARMISWEQGYTGGIDRQAEGGETKLFR
jgi:DNA-binding IclR family transcriptional regulator